MTNIGVFVHAQEIWPDCQIDFQSFRSLLQNLSRMDTLFWCARLNLVLGNPSNTDHLGKQNYAIEIFFTSEERARINRFANNEGGAEKVTVFFRGQLLELMRWTVLFCEDKPDDGKTFGEEEVRRTFAKAALIASGLWGHRVYPHQFSTEGGLDEARRRVLSDMRLSFSETSSGMDPLSALGRGNTLFSEYLLVHYPEFLNAFEKTTDITLEDYYSCLAAMMTSFLNRTPEKTEANNGLFNVKKLCRSEPHARELVEKYLSLESQTADELREVLWSEQQIQSYEDAPPFDLRPIRQKPILRAPDGRAIVMDPVFYAEKATVGPLFYVLGPNATDQHAKNLFGGFGHAFQDYSCSLLESMYPNDGSDLHHRFVPKLQGENRNGNQVEIADGCVNDVTDVILFEMKAAWIPDKALLDTARYHETLQKKYGAAPGEEQKGVAQLARSISRLVDGEWTSSQLDLGQLERIYPVLLVHDPVLDAPLHSEFLASEFDRCLSPDQQIGHGWLRKGALQLTRLTLMTIEDLELLETSVEYFSLRGLLRDYSVNCADRRTSFYNYIVASEYRKKLRRSKTVAAQSLEVLNRTAQKIFQMQ